MLSILIVMGLIMDLDKLKQIAVQLPETILDILLLILLIPRKLVNEINKITIDNLHYYLQVYNVIEVSILSVLLWVFIKQSNIIVENGLTMEVEKIAALSLIPLTIWPLIQVMITSLNKDIHEVYSKLPDDAVPLKPIKED
jgi:hypothetical protein